MPKTTARPANAAKPSREDVIHLVGDLDESVVTKILDTGASYVEIEEAVKWALGDAEQLRKDGRTLNPIAEAVYDVLTTEPSFLPPKREQ